jgi:competence protein ComEC
VTFVALAFAAGAALLQLQAALPSLVWSALVAPLALGALRWRPLAVVAAFAAGFFWAAACAQWRMDERLAPALEGRDLTLVGVVAGLPTVGERGSRFEFEVQSSEAPLPRKILLAWYDATATVHPGERWALTVRLRRPHGGVNPHGFDYEAWLLERGIGATGYVRAAGGEKAGFRANPLDRIEQTREGVRDRLLAVLGPSPAQGILAALAVGDQRAISREEWQLFNRTGVTHLMSISGLHVTLISGLAAWLVAAVWRRVPRLALRAPARKSAAVAAIVAALGYTLLAGYAVPAQRTFWMVTVFAAALWCDRIAAPWRTLALALAVVVLMDPWAPLSPGLWLSFGAVALIFYAGAGWRGSEPRLAQWARVQWAITLGLAPAALLLFGQVSLAGPLANAVAIPLVSVIITPLALLAAALPVDSLLHLAAWLVQWLLEFLEWCAALPSALWQQHAPSIGLVLLALAGAAWLLAPRGVPWRPVGAALMAPAFLSPPAAPAPAEAWITAFDVGQGLAVLVRTANHAVLYDTGPAFVEDDSGARVIVPALRAAGVGELDLLVLSHEDGDHLGGALSVLESFEVRSLASSLPREHPLLAFAAAAHPCRRGDAWQWDGVRFAFLHPGSTMAKTRRNDGSCVLRVTAGRHSLLLTGDIERAAEMELVKSAMPASDVIVVPHHGSRTSSSAEFLAAASPRWAIVPVGYRSRFGHPHPQVLERYRAAGVEIARTDLDGAVHVLLKPGAIGLATERRLRQRYWLQ